MAPKVKAVVAIQSSSATRNTIATPQDIQRAIRDNPTGVKLIQTGSLDVTPLLAGYLCLRNTQDLREFFAKVTELPEAVSYMKARHAGFGVNGKTDKSNWQIKHLFDFILHPTNIDKDTLGHSLPLPLEKFPAKDERRGYVSFIATMYQIIRRYPQRFPVTENGIKDTRQILMGIEAENWYRAYQILRLLWREKNESRKALKNKDSNRKSKTQNKVAETPVFLTNRDYRNASSDEADKLTTVNLPLRRYLDGEFDAIQDQITASEEQDTEAIPQDPAAEDKAFEAFEKSFRNVPGRLDHINKQDAMPQLDDGAIRQVLAHLGKRAKILFGDPSRTTTEPTHIPSDASAFAEQSVQRADTEGAAKESGEMDDKLRETFWELQRTMNTASACTPPYEECCSDLGLNPKKPKLGSLLILKPWQVTGIWWILYMWKFGLGTGLLGDDVGLGKTITSLAAVVCGSQLARNPAPNASIDLGLCGPFKPTLVICPASAFGVWKEEALLFDDLGLSLYLWAGSESKAEVADRHRTLGTDADALRQFCGGFEEDNPKTALMVVVTTYQTFHMRSLEFTSTPVKNKKGKAKEQHNDDDSDEEDLEDEEADLTEEDMRTLTTKTGGLFSIVLADESHKLKTVRTRTHQAVAHTQANNILLISATPTINRSSDLFGTLSLMWENIRPDLLPEKELSLDESIYRKDLEEYREKAEEIRANELTAVNLVDFESMLPFLNPRVFASLVSKEKQLTTDTAVCLMPPILCTIQIRRVKGQIMTIDNKDLVIGKEIPPYTVVTVEVEMGHKQATDYTEIHRDIVADMKGGAQGQNEVSGAIEGCLDMKAHRKLCHATLHPGLHSFHTSRFFTTAKMKGWNDLNDYGYSLFHRIVYPDPSMPSYRERIGAAVSVGANSVKLQVLAGIVHDICYRDQGNLIVFTSWPSTQWLVEMFLHVIGVPVLSIRAAHSRKMRTETQDAFNDMGTQGHVLVTNIKCGATSMNLQKNCFHMVFMEVSESANSTSQAIGRIHRIGQSHVQRIWILTANYTYDGTQQARAAKKMYGQIAGQSDLEVTQEAIEQQVEVYKAQTAGAETAEWANKNEPFTEEEMESRAISYLQHRKVVELYTTTFGQRTPRHGWDNIRLLAQKDLLPDEMAAKIKIIRKSAFLPKLTVVNLDPNFFRIKADPSLIQHRSMP